MTTKSFRPPARAPRGTSGITLLETLLYVVILAVVVNLGARAFVDNTRLSALGVAGVAAFDALEDIRADFTDAVQSADGVVPGAGTFRSDAAHLVVRQPIGPDDSVAARYVVFGMLQDKPRLYRLTLTQTREGVIETERAVAYGRDVGAVTFDYGTGAPGASAEPARARLVTMTVTAPPPVRGTTPPEAHQFTAAIRNAARENEP